MVMHTTLILIHVGTMIASLVLMGSALGLGLFGKSVAVRFAGVGFIASIAGFISGGALLFGATLSLQCGLLASYLVAMTVLYHVGFGFGDIARARFVRQLTPVQND